ncbi:MAG: S41 family peptidase [Sphaerochaetaceae bacterium]|nr:S41 family peptidase [Sphaerochaetaceae bacterium]
MQIRKTLTAALLSLSITLSLFASPEKELYARTASAGQGMNIYNSGISSTLIGLNTLYQYINTYFLYDIDLEKVNESLTSGLLSALDDPYSEYIAKDQAEDFEEDIDGTYVGIGTYLTKYKLDARDFSDPNTYMVQIMSPFPGSPAAKAGIRSRDLISHIDKESTTDMTATEASKKIRGKEGESVVLTIHRGSAVFDVTIVREKITRPSVDSTIVEGTDIGYITITDFNQATYTLVTAELDKLKEKGMKHLILDLRNNGGGTVDTAVLVADVFLEGGKDIVTVKYKEGSKRQDTTSQSSPAGTKYLDIDIAILTNGGTASASEILTAALKDNKKAITIGTKTFGKGVMQDVFKWNDGFVKFTSASYLTPNKNDINKVGIEPDIEIKEPEYSDKETVAFYDFLKDSIAKEDAFTKEHPELTQENLELFAKENEASGVPSLLLKQLIRNSYMNKMEYEDRPKIDMDNDAVLNAAINYFKTK